MADRLTVPLSQHLGLTHEQLEEIGILDVILGTDTKLFIDPKLLDGSQVPELHGSREDIKLYFSDLIRIHKQSDKVPRLQQETVDRIAIKEPQGLSIGYGDSRDSGTAIPESVARQSLRSLSEMILVGVEDERVMELLGLFIEGFGPDSISDLVVHIIYSRLCEATQRISKDLRVDTREFKINGKEYQLPAHPFKNHQLIFIPYDIVRNLPLATDWEEVIAAAQHNAAMRQSFNEIVGDAVKQFIKGIKKNPSILTSNKTKMETLIKVYADAQIEPYDIVNDPLAQNRITKYSASLPDILDTAGRKPTDLASLITLINDKVIEQYRRCIENNAGNTLLYKRSGQAVDPTKPVKEDAAQTLFFMVADIICATHDILLSREPNAGQGAVDFSLGTGYKDKVLVEIKKSTNNKLLDGYSNQLESYIENEKAAHAFYVVVVVKEANKTNEDSQLNKLQKEYAKNIREGKKCPTLVVIDGLIHESPSKRDSQ
ncbi:hypothetical protein B7Y94_00890 [Candidatus Saccharibacteria bacterium 32-49-12]|nr:MAG: hypothetical protein B7Y94_00890 [Candidatus Saccharibacteria bacterium 32-49-12]